MANKKLVTTGLITALLVSNLVIGYQYKQDTKEYEKQIEQVNNTNSYRQSLINEKNAKIDVLREVIQDNKNQIHSLKQQLEKAKHDSVSPSVSISRGETANYKAYFEVTAYTAGVESTGKNTSHPAYGLTASGSKVKDGRTIACPPKYPFGTKMKIADVGYRVCEDRGGAIKSGHLDLYMSNLSDAIEFGRKTLLVEILEEG